MDFAAAGIGAKQKVSRRKRKQREDGQVNQSLKTVLDYLKKRGWQKIEWSSIKELRGHPDVKLDIDLDEPLRTRLRAAKRIKWSPDGTSLRYSPEFEINNRGMLLRVVGDHPDGIALSRLKESYKEVLTDCQTLADEGGAYKVKNDTTKEETLYPLHEIQYEVLDERVKDSWEAVNIPTEHELDQFLKDNKLGNQEKKVQKNNKRNRSRNGRNQRRQHRTIINKQMFMGTSLQLKTSAKKGAK